MLHCFLVSMRLQWFTKPILIVSLSYKSSRELQKKCVVLSCILAVLQVLLIKDDKRFINATKKYTESAGCYIF